MNTREEFRTDSKMTKRAVYECNHFHRLPEDIIVSIFDRVADLKCLCHCSLVSKHFASVVYRVTTVSITVTGDATYDDEAWEKMYKLLPELVNGPGSVEQLHTLLDSLSFQNMKLPVFLDKLTELKFVYLDYDYTGKSVDSCIPMCKIKFYGDGSKIKSFVALESPFMHKDTENEAEEEKIDVIRMTKWLRKPAKSWLRFCARYMEWICFVMVLVKYHTSPQRVTITDSEVHGKMVIGDEDGVNLDMGMLCKLMARITDFIVRYGRAPVLRLPLSGYKLTYADLVIACHPENPSAHAENVDEKEFLDFEDEFPVLHEAVQEFLKKYKDRLSIIIQ